VVKDGAGGASTSAAGSPAVPRPTPPVEGKVEADLDVAALSGDLAAALCHSLRTCLGEQKLSAFVDGESCETRFTASFAQSDFGTLADSVKRGRVETHLDKLEQCYADTRARGCDIQTQRLPSSCQEALQGTVEVGATCTTSSDCVTGSFCPSSACPRVCSARHVAAESCARDEECDAGLICVRGKCGAPAAVGAACAGSSGGVCALGTSCVGSTKDQAGKCVENKKIQVGAVGDTCTPGGTLCQEGLSCAYDGSAGFNCQSAVSSGAVCHLALPSQCPQDEYCTASDVTTQGQCAPLPKDGEACVLGSECAGGHVCVAAADMKPVCAKLQDLGAACTQDAVCRSGHCRDSQCVVTEVCD
jgi:hypothetical protein